MSKSKMISCKSCGAEIAKSAKTCPHCGAKNKQHKGLGIVLVILGVLIFIGALSGGEDDPTKVGESSKIESEENSQTEKTEFTIGEKVALHDVVVTLVDVSENSGENVFCPTDGNVFIVCEFEIENNSSSDIAVSSMLSFEAYVDDYATTINLSAMTSSNKSQLDGSVAAGKKMNGVVGYEIPKDWSELEIRFTPNFWSGKEITFKHVK